MKRILVTSLLLFPGLVSFVYWPKTDLKSFGQPKYFHKFHTKIEPTFFDYDQALKVAKENDRLLLVSFTCHCCVGSRDVQFWPREYTSSRTFIENKLVFCELYVDDRTIKLDSSEWFHNAKGNLIKFYAKKNSYLQASKYDSNAQPFFALIDPTTNETIETFTYDSYNKNTWKLMKAYFFNSVTSSAKP